MFLLVIFWLLFISESEFHSGLVEKVIVAAVFASLFQLADSAIAT